MTMEEIKKRLTEIAAEIEQLGDAITEERLTALEKEARELLDKQEAMKNAAEQRQNLLASIAEGRTAGTVLRSIGTIGDVQQRSNMIAALVPGQLTFRCPDAPERLAAVSAGMIKVEDNDVLVLVDAAERPEDIDAIRARRKADEAREILLQKKSRQEYRTAQATLARALNRLRVKEHREL